MKNLFKLFMLMAVAAVGMVSCQETNEEYYENSNNIDGTVIYASTPTQNQTKMVFTDNLTEGIALEWDTDDVFTIYGTNEGGYTGCDLDHFECIDAEKGLFQTTKNFEFVDGESYTAIYPKTNEGQLSDAFQEDLTSFQDGDEINNLSAACLMKADFVYEKGKDINLNFEHLKAIMTFSFKSEVKPSMLVFVNGDDPYIVEYNNIEPDGDGIYTSHIMINPCEEGERTLTFGLYDSNYEIYDTRSETTSKAYVAGYRYTASVSDYTSGMWSGKGTELEPYEISTADQLYILSVNVDAGNSYAGKYFKLTQSIDLEGFDDNGNGDDWFQFQPIGGYVGAFSGVFDGADNTISGLYINRTSTYKALFGNIDGATIKNLTVEGEVTGGDEYAAGISAYTINSTIDNCHSSVEVTGEMYVGGISGYSENSRISNSTNSADITSESVITWVLGEIGGISGYLKTSTITNCSNSGNITSKGKGNCVGGIVGDGEESTIELSSNNGIVTSEGSYVGGIAGYIDCVNINKCKNSGKISSDNNNVGGIIGYSTSDDSKDHYVINCFNNAEISGNDYVGGIVGRSYEYLTLANCYNHNSVAGDYYIGGIIGYSSSSLATNCYNSSEVTGSDSVGAVFGNSSSSTINSCYYNSDAFTGSTSYGEAKSSDDMKDEAFVTLLNNNAYSYNSNTPTIKALAWVVEDNDYPTLDFTDDNPEYTAPVYDLEYNESDGLYEIKNEVGLQAFADLVNGIDNKTAVVSLASGNSFGSENTSISGKLMDDMDLEGGEGNQWTPIGAYSTSYTSRKFKGKFDGNKKKISGLYISSSSTYQGLFGYVHGATISDLTVEGSVKSTADYYVGGIVGYAVNSSTISNCYCSVEVEGVIYTGGVVGYLSSSTVTGCENYSDVIGSNYRAGGVVGYALSSNIESCKNSGNISATKTVGGILGDCNNSSTTLTLCVNSGNVEATTGGAAGGIVGINNGVVGNSSNSGDITGADEYIGGIAGSSDGGSVSNCQNSGDVSSSGEGYVGGIVGDNYTAITGCTNSGNVSGKDRYVGGIAGISSEQPITNCTNSAGYNVEGTSDVGGIVGNTTEYISLCNNGAKVTGSSTDVGGIAGYTSGSTAYIEECVNSGSISGEYSVGGVVGMTSNEANSVTSCSNSGDVTGSSTASYGHIGGVVGQANGEVEECYNSGTISGYKPNIGGVVGYALVPVTKCYNNGSVISESSYVGGVVGYAGSSATIDQCYNDVNRAIEGTKYVGGIVGNTYAAVSNCYNRAAIKGSSSNVGGVAGSGGSTISYCYSTATVTSESSSYIGGVIGSASISKITNCYYDNEVFTGSTSYGTGSTTMLDESFVDLLNVDQDPAPWVYNASENDGYPIFTW